MTQQRSDDRTSALRAMLVELPTGQRLATRSGTDTMRRVLLTTAAIGLVASAAVLVIQPSPSADPGSQPPVSPGGEVPGPSTGSASRVTLYGSLDELVADSGAVVAGTVVEQGPGPDGTTVSTIDVARVFAPSTLGSTSPEPVVQVPESGTVRVRTFGGAVSSVPTTSLVPGATYLLFLTPTGLPNAEDDEFFITGVVAGLYEAQGDRYVQVAHDGDVLPEDLTAEDLD